MIATATFPVSYAGLWDRACELLAPLGLTETGTPPGRMEGVFRLSSGSWAIGPGEPALAECRVARLSGPSADAFVAVILPADPARLPAFTAELYATGGRPSLAYLDLPSPGLSRDLRDEVTDQTTVLSIRHAPFLPRDETPPTWVMDDSPGGFLFTRTGERGSAARLSQAFEDYLNVWIDFAFLAAELAPTARCTVDRLVDFKRRSSHHASARAMLAQHFGLDWTDRFVTEFLYR